MINSETVSDDVAITSNHIDSQSCDQWLENASSSQIFAKMKDNRLIPVGVSRESFEQLCSSIFAEKISALFERNKQIPSLAFTRFDKNSDGILDEDEFQDCFTIWIEPILRPKNCLVIVDVQNDFITGSLALKNCPAKQNGYDVIPVINRILSDFPDFFQSVVYTQDWHPANHCSFVENVKLLELDPNSLVSKDDAKPFDTVIIKGSPSFQQQLFPTHCVQCSFGAELHRDLTVLPSGHFIRKGKSANIDSFSVFMDNQKKTKTELDEILTKNGVTDVYICGLAMDYCVGSTAIDAIELGYRTVVIKDACRGCNDDFIAVMENRIAEKDGVFVDTAELASMLNGPTRHPGLALQGLSDAAVNRNQQRKSSLKMQ